MVARIITCRGCGCNEDQYKDGYCKMCYQLGNNAFANDKTEGDTEMTEVELEELKETILSIRNMVDLSLLSLEANRIDLLPTGLEEAYYKLQELLDEYCIRR